MYLVLMDSGSLAESAFQSTAPTKKFGPWLNEDDDELMIRVVRLDQDRRYGFLRSSSSFDRKTPTIQVARICLVG